MKPGWPMCCHPGDFADRRRYVNARNNLDALLNSEWCRTSTKTTPRPRRIRIGDNDNHSAQVANLVEADLLVLLTDQDGLYTADPRQDGRQPDPPGASGPLPEHSAGAGGTSNGWARAAWSPSCRRRTGRTRTTW